MDDDLRACIAYIVSRLANPRITTYILDHQRKRFLLMSGTVSIPSVGILDHHRRVRVTGNSRTLFDHGLRTHVSLDIDGDRFGGFVFASSTRFEGEIEGNLVTISDHGKARNYQYTG
jgi:hypothetical protein